MKEKKYEIWCEGFLMTGGGGKAFKFGDAKGVDFLDACKNYFAENPSDNFRITNGEPIWWGCRLFDNEKDARKSFG
jgi:hypothetical protein